MVLIWTVLIVIALWTLFVVVGWIENEKRSGINKERSGGAECLVR